MQIQFLLNFVLSWVAETCVRQLFTVAGVVVRVGRGERGERYKTGHTVGILNTGSCHKSTLSQVKKCQSTSSKRPQAMVTMSLAADI